MRWKEQEKGGVVRVGKGCPQREGKEKRAASRA